MEPLLRCEEYTVYILWDRHYSSSILGQDRPPLAGVARDIITLAENLSRTRLDPQPIVECLKEFYDTLFSIPPPLNQSLDREWAARDLFADFFSLAIAHWGPTDHGRDDFEREGGLFLGRHGLQSIKYPGPDALRLGKSPVDREHGTVNGLWGTLEEMKAYFINSGPYKIELSTTPEEHLTLSSTGKLRVFWEGPDLWAERGAKPLYPGHATFKLLLLAGNGLPRLF